MSDSIEDGEVGLKKSPHIKMLPSKFSLIATIQSQHDDDLNNSKKIPIKLKTQFDFILRIKSSPNELIKMVTKNLFKN